MMGGFKAMAAGVNDNDVLLTFDNSAQYSTFMIMSEAGAMDVFVSLDGTHYSTAPLTLADFGAVVSDPVIVTAAHRMYGFRGVFRTIKVMQNGGTAVTGAYMGYGNI